jgi:hypothetical protein
MFTNFTTSSIAATKVTLAWTTPVPAQNGLQAGDLTLAGRCAR